MGIFLDKHYWANVTNSLFALRSMPGEPMKREAAVEALKIACKAFSDLADDPDLEIDIQESVNIAQKSLANRPVIPEDFEHFLSTLKKVEKDALLKSGVDLNATAHIISDIEKFTKETLTEDDFIALSGKISSVRNFICTTAADPKYRNSTPEPSLENDVWHGTLGVSAAGIDLAVAGIVDPATAMFLGNSIGYGYFKMRRLIRRCW